MRTLLAFVMLSSAAIATEPPKKMPTFGLAKSERIQDCESGYCPLPAVNVMRTRNVQGFGLDRSRSVERSVQPRFIPTPEPQAAAPILPVEVIPQGCQCQTQSFNVSGMVGEIVLNPGEVLVAIDGIPVNQSPNWTYSAPQTISEPYRTVERKVNVTRNTRTGPLRRVVCALVARAVSRRASRTVSRTSYSGMTRSQLIHHLQGLDGGPHRRSYASLAGLSTTQLNAIHNREHGW